MSQKSYDNTPTLYLIPTPIGNMQDITLRAIETFKFVDVVFTEDTRDTGLLLNQLEIKKKMVPSHKFNEEISKNKMLEYLKNGQNVGLASDRGTPAISDPGYILVKHAIDNGFNVVSLPGATALIPALIMSGINPQPFLFYGFLNNKEGKKTEELLELKNNKSTLIFYESPHRIEKTLEIMQKSLGNRNISISREISKKYEEVYRGTINLVKQEVENVKGELVIVVEGNLEKQNFDNITVIEHVNLFIKEGKTKNDAIKLVAKERNVPKSEIYNQYIK
ncbi:MAG: 16S rRNA (cytidine(1402)-2'-O)-methyltransferase [Mycoplasmatota bacterium]